MRIALVVLVVLSPACDCGPGPNPSGNAGGSTAGGSNTAGGGGTAGGTTAGGSTAGGSNTAGGATAGGATAGGATAGGATAGGATAGGATAGGGAPVDAGVWVCDGGWCLQPQGDGGSQLRSIWGSGASDIWTVGDDGITLHWDGVRWQSVTSGTNQQLSAVWGTSASDVWAVGNAGTTLHWDGAAWSKADSGTSEALSGVWASSPNDAWAVGRGGAILHWTGAGWNPDAGISTEGRFLNHVWGSGPNDVWATGLGFVYRYNGFFWSRTDLPDTFGSQTMNVLGITGTGPNAVWAIGYTPASALQIIMRWNGTQWQQWGNGGTAICMDGLLTAGWTVSASDIWAVGYQGPGCNPPNIVAHWDGGVFTNVPVGSGLFLWDVWASGPNDVWAVGTRGVILHRQ